MKTSLDNVQNDNTINNTNKTNNTNNTNKNTNEVLIKKKGEPLLEKQENRYVLYPIVHNDVWYEYKKQMSTSRSAVNPEKRPLHSTKAVRFLYQEQPESMPLKEMRPSTERPFRIDKGPLIKRRVKEREAIWSHQIK